MVDAGLVVEKFIRFSSKTPLENIMNPIKNVSKITTRDTFVLDVKNDIEDSLVKIQTIIKSYSEIYNEFSKEGDSILSKISNKINRLKIDCDTASDIPRWVEHWFRKDNGWAQGVVIIGALAVGFGIMCISPWGAIGSKPAAGC